MIFITFLSIVWFSPVDMCLRPIPRDWPEMRTLDLPMATLASTTRSSKRRRRKVRRSRSPNQKLKLESSKKVQLLNEKKKRETLASGSLGKKAISKKRTQVLCCAIMVLCLEIFVFVAGCLITPLVFILGILLVLFAAGCSIPLFVYRQLCGTGNSTFRILEESETRKNRFDLPYLRRAVRSVPAFFVGPSSLLIMILDPQIARAVINHSTYMESPISRLFETLKLVYTLTTADAEMQERAVKYIAMKHKKIKGPGYSAESLKSQTFVWANLVATIEFAYNWCTPESTCVTEKEKTRFFEHLYADWRQWAINFGIEERYLPTNRIDFYTYYHQAVADFLPPHEDTVELASGLFAITTKWYLLPVFPITHWGKSLSVALLPENVKQSHKVFGHGIIGDVSKSLFWFLWYNCPYYLRKLILNTSMKFGDVLPMPTKSNLRDMEGVSFPHQIEENFASTTKV